jgi:hypothetical protein
MEAVFWGGGAAQYCVALECMPVMTYAGSTVVALTLLRLTLPVLLAAVCRCCPALPLLLLLCLQLLGCRGALAERDAGQVFHTPARICQVPVHGE